MRRDLLPQLVIGVLVAAAIALGLAVTGGPKAGQMEKRDQARLSDLRNIGEYVLCLANDADKTLPTELSEDATCMDMHGQVRLADPFNGEVYRYELLDSDTFRVCASFERYKGIEAAGYRSDGFSPESGCLTRAFTAADRN
jgi:hypothetical protein